MTTVHLVNHCPACGAEEALDVLIGRMIDHDDTRRLVADLVGWSLPIGSLVVRYLRLFKPAKQQLRMKTVHAALAELVPAIKAGQVQRAGRIWHMGNEGWRGALEAVLDAHSKGTLQLPLQGNAYLFEVAKRMADVVEGRAEEAALQDARNRPGAVSPPAAIADALTANVSRSPAPTPVPGTSPLVRQMKAQLEKGRERHE